MKKTKILSLESLANATKFAIKDPEAVLGYGLFSAYVIGVSVGIGYFAYSGVRDFFTKNPQITNDAHKIASDFCNYVDSLI